MAKQRPTLVKLIPIEPMKSEEGQEESSPVEYLYEPGPEELLIDLLPKNIGVQIANAFLQNETSEHAARMVAMAKQLSIEPATPAEAREIIGLKGIDQVNF